MRVTPVKKKDGSYALGLWVKDDISGIGTITYTDGERFAALGHSINDNDTGIMFRVSDGAVYETTIVRIKKPEADKPGRLEGIINYTGRYVIGRVEENSAFGIHGYLTKRQQKTHTQDIQVAVGRNQRCMSEPRICFRRYPGSRNNTKSRLCQSILTMRTDGVWNLR